MIPQIYWSESRINEKSPFLRDVQRPLRITFDTPTLAELPPAESEAYDGLCELSNLSEIEALQTAPGAFPHMEIGDSSMGPDYIPVNVKLQKGYRSTGIPRPSQLVEIASDITGQPAEDPQTKSLLNCLLIARGHIALGQDILITESPLLLKYRSERFVREANPRTPLEAVKIVGLFLRSRGVYAYKADRLGSFNFDRGLFYWVLVREKLPSMWYYFNACVEAEKARSDDTLLLGQSILTRCGRALEGRDAIGEQFFIPQDNGTRDRIMYHFDYLTLLLAGIFDAEARIAHRAYRITGTKERDSSFRTNTRRGQEFLNRLKTAQNARELVTVVSSQRFQDLCTLIYTLRNTIHSSSLLPFAYSSSSESEQSFVRIPGEYQEPIWNAAQRNGTAEAWGLIARHRAFLEPYSYSVSLVENSLKMIDTVAACTDVRGLFPAGHSIPQLMRSPPDDEVFGANVRKRLAVLG